MNFQKAKGILILVIVVSLIAGVTYLITVSYYLPKLESKVVIQQNNMLNMQSVVVAAKDIPMGTLITPEYIKIASIPGGNLADANKIYTADKIPSLYGKVAVVNIYNGEQILTDKLISEVEFTENDWKNLDQVQKRNFEPSFRYITVDIPKYNFVNERVGVNSLVDILLDKGQGRYDVVLAKISILDKVAVGLDANSAQQNVNKQIVRPLPKPLLIQQQANQGQFPGTATQLLIQNNPAVDTSEDYRVTIMVSEKEQKRLYEATTYGKLMLRKYVFPNQPASIVTFTSAEQAKVVRDGTVEIPKAVKPASIGSIKIN